MTTAMPNETICNQAVCRSLAMARLISFESDQILYHAAKISADPQVADQDPLLIQPYPGGHRLLAGPRIDVAYVHVELVEDRIAFGRLALLEGFAIQLLDQKHDGASGQDAVVPDQFLPGRARGEKGDDLFLRQRRLAAEDRLGRERCPKHVHVHGVIADKGGPLQVDLWVKRIARVEIE